MFGSSVSDFASLIFELFISLSSYSVVVERLPSIQKRLVQTQPATLTFQNYANQNLTIDCVNGEGKHCEEARTPQKLLFKVLDSGYNPSTRTKPAWWTKA